MKREPSFGERLSYGTMGFALITGAGAFIIIKAGLIFFLSTIALVLITYKFK